MKPLNLKVWLHELQENPLMMQGEDVVRIFLLGPPAIILSIMKQYANATSEQGATKLKWEERETYSQTFSIIYWPIITLLNRLFCSSLMCAESFWTFVTFVFLLHVKTLHGNFLESFFIHPFLWAAQGQIGYTITKTSSESTLGSFPVGCAHKKEPRRDPNKMPQPPQLAAVDVKGQRFSL